MSFVLWSVAPPLPVWLLRAPQKGTPNPNKTFSQDWKRGVAIPCGRLRCELVSYVILRLGSLLIAHCHVPFTFVFLKS